MDTGYSERDWQNMWLRKGVKLLEETAGAGDRVQRRHYYLLAIRIALSRGDVVRFPNRFLGPQVDEHCKVEEDGYFRHRARIDRESLAGGIFYSVLGMRVGGYRKVDIAPHLAYGAAGVPGIIPPNAKLTVEIKVLDKS